MFATLLCTLCTLSYSKVVRMATYDNIQHVLDANNYLTRDAADKLYTRKDAHNDNHNHDRSVGNPSDVGISVSSNTAQTTFFAYKLPSDFSAESYKVGITYERVDNSNNNIVSTKSVVFDVSNKKAISSNPEIKKLETPVNDISVSTTDSASFADIELERYMWLYDITDTNNNRYILLGLYSAATSSGLADHDYFTAYHSDYSNKYYLDYIKVNDKIVVGEEIGGCSTNNANNYKIFSNGDDAIKFENDAYVIDTDSNIKDAQSVLIEAEVHKVHFVVQSSMKNMGSSVKYDDVAVVNNVKQYIRLHISTADSKLEIYAATIDKSTTPDAEDAETRISDKSNFIINYVAIHE